MQRNSIKKAGKKASGASMYVTLEPCFHSSQNGSCADQILRSGIKKFIFHVLILILELKIKVLSN